MLAHGLNLKTAVLGWDVLQSQVPAVAFVHKYKNVFAFKFAILYLFHPTTTKSCAVRHSSGIWTKSRISANIRTIWTSMSRIPLEDHFPCLVNRRKLIRAAMFGMRSSMPR